MSPSEPSPEAEAKSGPSPSPMSQPARKVAGTNVTAGETPALMQQVPSFQEPHPLVAEPLSWGTLSPAAGHSLHGSYFVLDTSFWSHLLSCSWIPPFQSPSHVEYLPCLLADYFILTVWLGLTISYSHKKGPDFQSLGLALTQSVSLSFGMTSSRPLSLQVQMWLLGMKGAQCLARPWMKPHQAECMNQWCYTWMVPHGVQRAQGPACVHSAAW